jgi:hypothetical protein
MFEPGFESKGPSTAPQRTGSASRWHEHPELALFRPFCQTLLPTPDTLRHCNRLCLTLPPIPLATAALRSAAACRQTAAASDDSPPGAT